MSNLSCYRLTVTTTNSSKDTSRFGNLGEIGGGPVEDYFACEDGFVYVIAANLKDACDQGGANVVAAQRVGAALRPEYGWNFMCGHWTKMQGSAQPPQRSTEEKKALAARAEGRAAEAAAQLSHEEAMNLRQFGACAADVMLLRKSAKGSMSVAQAVGSMMMLGQKMKDTTGRFGGDEAMLLFIDERWPEFVEMMLPETKKEYQEQCVKRLADALD